jgi:hypothetical protein
MTASLAPLRVNVGPHGVGAEFVRLSEPQLQLIVHLAGSPNVHHRPELAVRDVVDLDDSRRVERLVEKYADQKSFGLNGDVRERSPCRQDDHRPQRLDLDVRRQRPDDLVERLPQLEAEVEAVVGTLTCNLVVAVQEIAVHVSHDQAGAGELGPMSEQRGQVEVVGDLLVPEVGLADE